MSYTVYPQTVNNFKSIHIRLEGVSDPVTYYFSNTDATTVFCQISNAINNHKEYVKFTDYCGSNIVIVTDRIISIELANIQNTVGV